MCSLSLEFSLQKIFWRESGEVLGDMKNLQAKIELFDGQI